FITTWIPTHEIWSRTVHVNGKKRKQLKDETWIWVSLQPHEIDQYANDVMAHPTRENSAHLWRQRLQIYTSTCARTLPTLGKILQKLARGNST
ncbi:unnamed protein product, partial [Pocillopora meandrina]